MPDDPEVPAPSSIPPPLDESDDPDDLLNPDGTIKGSPGETDEGDGG